MRCEVCGNEYDKAFRVTMPGDQPHVFSELLNKETLVSEVEATAAKVASASGT